MMPNTHVITSNGRARIEVDHAIASRLVARGVAMLDGERRFAVSLARLPEGTALGDRPPEGWPHSFLQSAGSAERMTIEMRTAGRRGADEPQHVVVGRATDGPSRPVVIAWAGGSQEVRDSEVFDAEEASRIYMHYSEHGTIPEEYVSRPLSAG